MNPIHNIKKKNIVSFLTVLTLVICTVTFSCKKQEQQISILNSFSSKNESFEIEHKDSTWQNQLNLTKSGDNVLSKNNMRLVSFQYSDELHQWKM